MNYKLSKLKSFENTISMSNKGLVSNIYKEHLQLRIQK